MVTLQRGDPVATALVEAIRSGDLQTLGRLLGERPGLAAARIADDKGADIEAQGASIGGGSPLDDAVGYGQWRAARRLVERGARTRLWHAAALGLMDRVEAAFASSPPPTRQEVTEAFWQACHGGQRQAAEYLLGRGADLNWAAAWDGRTPLDIARNQDAEELAGWLGSRGARSAGEPG